MKRAIIFLTLFFLILILSVPVCSALNLSSPRAGKIFMETERPLFTWDAVPRATQYHIQVYDREFPSGTFNWDFCVVNETEISSTSFQMPSELAVKTYYWRVRAMTRDEGDSPHWQSWSRVLTFRVWPLPKSLELTSPLNGSRVNSLRPEFIWRDPSHYGEHRDKIQVSADAGFRTIVFEEEVELTGRGALLSPVDLEYGITYYWRVRFERIWPEVEGVSMPGSWSDVQSFEVFLGLPPKVFLISPRYDAYVSSPATFSWNEIAEATMYNLVISDQEDFSDTSLRLFPDTNSLTTPLTIDDGTYYWRARARNTSGWGEWSQPRRLIKGSEPAELETPWETEEETDPTLSRPELYSPKGLVETDRPEFSWRGFAETPTRDPRYHIQVSTDPDFDYLVVNDRSVYDTSYRCPRSLTAGYTYYWRVKARERSDRDWGPWSEVESFWLSLTSDPVTLISPEENAVLRTTRPEFSWEADFPYGPQGEFELEVSDRSGFFTTVFRTIVQPSGDGGSILFPHNLSDGRYFWHVRQKITDDRSWGTWSNAWSFRVDVTAPVIRILLPTERRISTSTIPARVTVSCEVIDNLTGVKKVEYYFRGRRVAQRTRAHHGSTYIADIPGLDEGRNTITIKAYDKAGGTGNMSQATLVLEIERILGIQKPPLLPKKLQESTKPGVIKRIPRRR